MPVTQAPGSRGLSMADPGIQAALTQLDSQVKDCLSRAKLHLAPLDPGNVSDTSSAVTFLKEQYLRLPLLLLGIEGITSSFGALHDVVKSRRRDQEGTDDDASLNQVVKVPTFDPEVAQAFETLDEAGYADLENRLTGSTDEAGKLLGIMSRLHPRVGANLLDYLENSGSEYNQSRDQRPSVSFAAERKTFALPDGFYDIESALKAASKSYQTQATTNDNPFIETHQDAVKHLQESVLAVQTAGEAALESLPSESLDVNFDTKSIVANNTAWALAVKDMVESVMEESALTDRFEYPSDSHSPPGVHITVHDTFHAALASIIRDEWQSVRRDKSQVPAWLDSAHRVATAFQADCLNTSKQAAGTAEEYQARFHKLSPDQQESLIREQETEDDEQETTSDESLFDDTADIDAVLAFIAARTANPISSLLGSAGVQALPLPSEAIYSFRALRDAGLQQAHLQAEGSRSNKVF